ncbi:hypothetical protein KOW79_022425 [Hemibagrus wyckioides]|uniref:Uncharacterized protein n=1 Tax=Hemibagrus wyckioides TaxID=337641 RepID=A0A9D3N0U2_9TELE|nr:hypothetical protein KOW79_022425 [Hemibagrus wyckioides]
MVPLCIKKRKRDDSKDMTVVIYTTTDDFEGIDTKDFNTPSHRQIQHTDSHMDRFLRALPSEERKAVGLRNPTSPRELLDGLECALATLEIGRDLRKADFRPPPRRPQGTRLPDTGSYGEKRRPEERPPRGPVDKPMPTEPEPTPPGRAPKPWLAGCVLHVTTILESPRVTVELNGRSVPALLDSGSTITLV